LLSILSLTVDLQDEDLWRGLALVAGLLLTNIVSSLFFIGSNTIGHIAGWNAQTSQTSGQLQQLNSCDTRDAKIFIW
jgi:hypothetical protein